MALGMSTAELGPCAGGGGVGVGGSVWIAVRRRWVKTESSAWSGNILSGWMHAAWEQPALVALGAWEEGLHGSQTRAGASVAPSVDHDLRLVSTLCSERTQ
jgi:hypothetical protein